MTARTRTSARMSERDRLRLIRGAHHAPHQILGCHPAGADAVVRAFHPEAVAAWCHLPDREPISMDALGGGLFAGLVPDAAPPLPYRVRFRFAGGDEWERDDPYRFLPTLGPVDLHLFGEGTHRRLWQRLGAHVTTLDGVPGVAFAVWAPNARRVSVVGDFCEWDGRLLPMRTLGSSGVFELFVPGVAAGALYKFEILGPDDRTRLKADPFAAWAEAPPGTASRVYASEYDWNDGDWIATREGRDPIREPMAIYEVHLGSWRRAADGGPLGYRDLAHQLADHVQRFGFTHVEIMPVAEHPFAGSWGYQVSSYFAPTARFGSPDDFRYLVDHLHQCGIGVILDWVPGHFPKDDFALSFFDGTALFEPEDPRRRDHPDWGTATFNYGRIEVRNFLLANALYWLDEFHADGLRFDAVASMLYLDYSRADGEWEPNAFGGRENLEAIDFLRATNDAIEAEHPGCVTVAEESTAWPGVTRPTRHGGLGFTFKWNLGWMHDTLAYFGIDPIHRPYHHDRLTFAMLYEHSERFVTALSHDEVVHGKRSLLSRMPGDRWQRFANLRALLAYQYTRPGKPLLFMGTELAPDDEWDHNAAIDWAASDDPLRRAFSVYLEALGALYRTTTCLWRGDPDADGFAWIDCHDRAHSVFAYQRRDRDSHAVVVLNLTPVPRRAYRIGAPAAGRYTERLSSDAARFGGSGYPTPRVVETESSAWHGHPQSMALDLPPLAAVVLAPERS